MSSLKDMLTRQSKGNAPKKQNMDEYAINVATYGHYCRSASYASLHNETWMEGLQVRPGEWKIRVISSELDLTDPNNAQRGETDIISGEETYCFIDVLNALYNFEKTHEANAAECIALTTANDLGMEHYIGFGMREGMAFDKTGKPLITVNGHILEGDNIPYSTMVAVKDAWAKKELLFMSDTHDLLPNFNLSIDENDLDTFLASLKNCQFVSDVRDKFEECINAFDSLLQDKSTVSLDGHSFFGRVSQLTAKIQAETPSTPFEPPLYGAEHAQVINRLLQYATTMELHGRLYVAKESFTRTFNGVAKGTAANKAPINLDSLKEKIMKDAKLIQEKYIRLGNEPVKLEQIQAEIIRLNQPFGHVLEARPKAFRMIMGVLDDMKARSVEIASELRLEALKKEHDQKRKEAQEKDKREGKISIGSVLADRMGPRF